MLLFWTLVLQLSCLTMAIPSSQGLSQEGEWSMEPAGARFERSTPSSLRSLRREMLGKFQEQEERLAEQERRIARQGETISKLEERIAEQQKTIEEQNETIQMIAKHPDIRDFLQGFQSEALSPEVLGPPLEDSLLLITGGSDGNSWLPSTEVYPKSTSGCFPPYPLPLQRTGHTTFLTSEPSPWNLVATCGGITSPSTSHSTSETTTCQVLDPNNQRWDESTMGNLTMVRVNGAAVTLNDIGVFIVGGTETDNAMTSEFLAAGSMQWQEGPALPVGMSYLCAVSITPTSFLTIFGTGIREFDTAIAGPTSSEGWREEGHWPELKTIRQYRLGCAKVGQKVIIAGGYRNGASLSSTEVLDLVDRRISSGEKMASPRNGFHLATIISGGEEKMFALAGYDGSTYLNEVEEWVEANSTWKAANNLVEKREGFGSVAVPRNLICPF